MSLTQRELKDSFAVSISVANVMLFLVGPRTDQALQLGLTGMRKMPGRNDIGLSIEGSYKLRATRIEICVMVGNGDFDSAADFDGGSLDIDEWLAAQRRFERLQQAKAELEQEPQAELKAALDNHVPSRPGPRKKSEQTSHPPKNRRQREKDKKRCIRARKNAAAPSRQYYFVDPDSRVMKDSGERG